MARMLLVLFFLVGIPVPSLAAESPDSPENRLKIASRLFELPVYRQLATRQIYAALKFLPAEEYRRAAEALSNPEVVHALQGVIARSMAETFSRPELEHIERFMAADEARTMLTKAESFQAVVIRELLAAAIADPELSRNLLLK